MKMIMSYNILKMINKNLMNLKVHSSMSFMCMLGSMTGIMLTSQIITGIFLTMHYSANTSIAFTSMINIHYNISSGELIRAIHANGASMFFILMFSHLIRNIYFSSFFLKNTWFIGTSILLISILTAFLGYVLPWGQMSFWGTTVITNLLSSIPYLGMALVNWVWGGFSVDNPTLSRFYTLHFLAPFIILLMTIFHLMALHSTGSSNPIGNFKLMEKIPFHPYFTTMDLIGFITIIILLMMTSLNFPNILMDPDNFSKANPMITPIHIQPEWYFLFAYSILRSVPNKFGGIIALVFSILILYMFPLLTKSSWMSNQFNPFMKLIFYSSIMILMILTWLGTKPMEYPYSNLAQMFSILYFFFMALTPFNK